jgi:acyl-coenzyme A synthetase/AMP-(fatty) acid ligase
VSAGESLPADVYRRWAERFHLEILDGIGTTEILHIFVSNRPGQTRPGSSGLPVPGYEVMVADESGTVVPPGEIGNLWVKGESTMASYWNRPDDMLKVGGIWVSPIEVENTLIAHPAVLEAAVVGHQDADRLVKPKAFVVLKDASQASPELAEELTEFVRARIAPYKRPRWVEFVPSLPKTATGKIQRYKLRESLGPD